jgi:hypothetical protein
MSRMDARRDTAVIPCGLKVDITCAANYEPKHSDNFRMRHSGPIHFLTAVCLSLGALVLLDAGLYSPTPNLKPSGGSIGAVLGHCIEGNRRTWSSLMNSVDDDFE